MGDTQACIPQEPHEPQTSAGAEASGGMRVFIALSHRSGGLLYKKSNVFHLCTVAISNSLQHCKDMGSQSWEKCSRQWPVADAYTNIFLSPCKFKRCVIVQRVNWCTGNAVGRQTLHRTQSGVGHQKPQKWTEMCSRATMLALIDHSVHCWGVAIVQTEQ